MINLPKNNLYLLVFILALVVRLWGIQWGLPFEYNHDEPHLVRHALKFGTGDLNPHWFLYPTLQMYMLFIMYGFYYAFGFITGVFSSPQDLALQYLKDPTIFYLLGRGLSAIMGALTVLFVYMIGKRLFDKKVSLLAALFMAFSPSHNLWSHYIKTDVPAVFFLTVSFYFSVKIFLEGKRANYIWAALFTGFAASTKYTGAIGIVAIVTAHLLRMIEYKDVTLRRVFGPYIFLALVVSLIGFIIGTPFSIFDFSTFKTYIVGLNEQSKIGWLGSQAGDVWLRVLTEYLRKGLGIWVVSASILGIGYFFVKRDLKMILLSSIPIIYYVKMAGTNYSFSYYWLPVLPFLALIAARVLTEVVLFIPVSKKIYANLPLFLGVLMMISPGLSAIKNSYSLTLPDTRTLAKEWIEENISFGTKVVVERDGPQLTPTKDSIIGEQQRKVKEIRQGFRKKTESYHVIPREPERNVSEYYRLVLTVPENPKSYFLYRTWSAGEKTLDKWIDEGFSYIVIGAMYHRYLSDTNKYPQAISFYQELEERAKQVKVVEPNRKDRIGPIIKIYKIENR